MQTSWPTAQQERINDSTEQTMQRSIELIESYRRLRSELTAPPSARPLLLVIGYADKFAVLGCDMIAQLCGCAGYEIRDELPAGLPQTAAAGFSVASEWHADKKQMLEQLNKKLEKAESELSIVLKALENESFVARAPEEVVEKKRHRADLLKQEIEDLQNQLHTIS